MNSAQNEDTNRFSDNLRDRAVDGRNESDSPVAVLLHAGDRHSFELSLSRLLDQSVPDLRIVAVDSMSNAASAELMEELDSEPQVTTLRFGTSINPWAALDLAATTFDFEAITFHFEGDLPESSKIRRQLQALEEGVDPAVQEPLDAVLVPVQFGVGAPASAGRRPGSLRWMRHPCTLCTGMFRPLVFEQLGGLFGDFTHCAEAHYRLSLADLRLGNYSSPLTSQPGGPRWSPRTSAYVPEVVEQYRPVRLPIGARLEVNRPHGISSAVSRIMDSHRREA